MMRGMINVIMMMGAGVRRMTKGLKLTTVVIKCMLSFWEWKVLDFERVTMKMTGKKVPENNLLKGQLTTNFNFMLG